MVETREITTVKLQTGSKGSRYVTIPKAVVNLLGLEKGEEFGVCINPDEDIVLHRRQKI